MRKEDTVRLARSIKNQLKRKRTLTNKHLTGGFDIDSFNMTENRPISPIMATANQAANLSALEAFKHVETYGIAPAQNQTTSPNNKNKIKQKVEKKEKPQQKKTQAKYLNALKQMKKKVDLTTKDNCIAYMHEMGRICELNFVRTDEEGFPIFLAKNHDEDDLIGNRPKKDFEAINFQKLTMLQQQRGQPLSQTNYWPK